MTVEEAFAKLMVEESEMMGALLRKYKLGPVLTKATASPAERRLTMAQELNYAMVEQFAEMKWGPLKWHAGLAEHFGILASDCASWSRGDLEIPNHIRCYAHMYIRLNEYETKERQRCVARTRYTKNDWHHPNW